MNNIDPGKFRHWVTLMRDSGTATQPNNEPIEDWQEVGQYYALVEQLSGKEAFYASQVTPLATHKITMWQVTSIYPNDRFDFDGYSLYIDSVKKIYNQNAFYEITATSRPPQG